MTQRAMQARRKAGPLRVARIVLSALFGVRRGRDHEEDAGGVNPIHVLIAGVIGVALFVLALLLLVRVITAQ